MKYAHVDDGRPIRARVNPLFMSVLMAFPAMWVVGMPVAFVQDSVDPAAAIAALVLFDAPIAALIVNFFWHYRLELTAERLSIKRYFYWGGTSIRIEDLTSVVIRAGPFGAPRMIFESLYGDIRLMGRGRGGNIWPPVILDRMLARLAGRGVHIDEEVREYLSNSEARKRASPRTAQVAIIVGIVALSLAMTALLVAARTGDVLFAFELSALTVPFLAGLYALALAIRWLNERHYGDLRAPVLWQSNV